MDFVWKLYSNTYAVHVTVALVGVATLNLALPAPPPAGTLKQSYATDLRMRERIIHFAVHRYDGQHSEVYFEHPRSNIF